MYNVHQPIQIDTAGTTGSNQPSVLVIYTGGTIGMNYDPSGSFLMPFDFRQIMDQVPELTQFNLQLSVLQIDSPIDSSDMSPKHWVGLAQVIEKFYADYHGFVILHGTDTMAYSASAMSFLLENLGKPVIFTGSQLPIGHKRTDGRENFISALEIASNQSVCIPEVCIFFDNLLLRANKSRKVQNSKFTAFKSENYPPLAIAGITIEYNESVILPMPTKKLRVYTELDSRVLIIKIFPGISQEYLNCIFQIDDLQAIIIETYGAGNVPMDEYFLKILNQAVQKDKIIYNVSQCNGGRVKQSLYDSGHQLNRIGVIGGSDITSESAVTKLMFLLSKYKNKSTIKQKLRLSLRGEITIN